ncbi:DinB family protein [Glutamicibacter arilaitensis]|uniref:DinB family protein n=1 Tax=Glutamicibacter arilaitensis TaxID=256701 RepID=UPI00384CFFB1
MTEIIPDDKNWTFVLESVCTECHHDVRQVSPAAVIEQLPQLVDRYLLALHRPQARERTSPTRWSDQEYVVHVADMLVTMTRRLELMSTKEDPTFPNWDQDQAAEKANYNALEVDEAAARLRAAASLYSNRLARISSTDYGRKGLRSNGAAFTVTTLNQYAWHDVLHHVWDLKA